MNNPDRRVRRTRKSLHEALLALSLEKDYDTITVQELLDRADVGRSTFYAHFQSKDELLMSGIDELRTTLNSAIHQGRSTARRHENLLGFSRAMFDHVNDFRKIYYALAHTRVFPLVRQQLLDLLSELIEKECRAELVKLKRSKPELPIDLFVSYLTTTFFTVLTWWLDRRVRASTADLDQYFRALVLPTVQAVLD
jgi:AcrR family transcriptional regulator